MRPKAGYGRYSAVITVLIGFTAVPNVSSVVHKAARAMAVAPGYVKLDAPDMGPLGLFSVKDIFAERAERMRGIYIAHKDTFEAIADTEALPSFLLFSDPDYQFLLLEEMQAVIPEIRTLELKTRRKFETVFTLDFANPFPYLLKRKGTKHVSIGADPNRTVPELDPKTREAVARTDLVLVPTCPVQYARNVLLEHYSVALEGHERVTLTPCYDAFVLPVAN